MQECLETFLCFDEYMFTFLFGTCLGVKLAGHRILYWALSIAQQFPSGYPVYTPH